MAKTRPDERDKRHEGTIYLIHFDEPYEHAKHYLGFTPKDVDERLMKHTLGTGSNLMRVVSAAGIPWRLARLWKGTRHDERRIKNRGGKARICPICSEKPWPVKYVEPVSVE